MKKYTFILASILIGGILASCTPHNGGLKSSTTVVSPNSTSLVDYGGWPIGPGGRLPQAIFDNSIAFDQISSAPPTFKVTCPDGQVLLIQKDLANGSSATKKCQREGGCSYVGIEAYNPGSNQKNITDNNETAPNQQELTVYNNSANYSGVVCIPKNQYADWVDE
ncbi:hypothetical protein [Francisella sp. LA112445]|uniref:hypothetical protein n=1 Tax=Francisella sp. LA112445 TaxID=1395624 RepID=UPI001788B142|nr:hypothetical protein [Francisella sp. LA112445]QIW09156.1 hypothetical protein FIP56_00055 [Francisella sp. LA112445]